MSAAPPEAFDLLTIPNATLTAPDVKESGTLHLVCVTVQHPDAADADRDVYLMMRVNNVETPIDPAGTIQRTDEPGSRTYTFHSTDIYPADRVVKVPTADSNQYLAEDLETFDNLLGQYSELRPGETSVPVPAPVIDKGKDPETGEYDQDLRGQLVAINEDTGEVIGQFDDTQFKLQEDPKMHEKGKENEPVYIEVSEDDEAGMTALELFARTIPPEEQDWITSGATVVRCVVFFRFRHPKSELLLQPCHISDDKSAAHDD
jgi:spartin